MALQRLSRITRQVLRHETKTAALGPSLTADNLSYWSYSH